MSAPRSGIESELQEELQVNAYLVGSCRVASMVTKFARLSRCCTLPSLHIFADQHIGNDSTSTTHELSAINLPTKLDGGVSYDISASLLHLQYVITPSLFLLLRRPHILFIPSSQTHTPYYLMSPRRLHIQTYLSTIGLHHEVYRADNRPHSTSDRP